MDLDDPCEIPPIADCVELILEEGCAPVTCLRAFSSIGVQCESLGQEGCVNTMAPPAPPLLQAPSPKDITAFQYYTHCVELHRILREYAAAGDRRVSLLQEPSQPQKQMKVPRKPHVVRESQSPSARRRERLTESSDGLSHSAVRASASSALPLWVTTLEEDNARLTRRVAQLTETLQMLQDAQITKDMLRRSEFSTQRKVFEGTVQQLEQQLRDAEDRYQETLHSLSQVTTQSQLTVHRNAQTLAPALHSIGSGTDERWAEYVWILRKDYEDTIERLRIESVLRRCSDSYAHLGGGKNSPQSPRREKSSSALLTGEERTVLLQTLLALGGDVTAQSVNELLHDPAMDPEHVAEYHMWVRETFLK